MHEIIKFDQINFNKTTKEDLIQAADEALYTSKENSRNQNSYK